MEASKSAFTCSMSFKNGLEWAVSSFTRDSRQAAMTFELEELTGHIEADVAMEEILELLPGRLVAPALHKVVSQYEFNHESLMSLLDSAQQFVDTEMFARQNKSPRKILDSSLTKINKQLEATDDSVIKGAFTRKAAALEIAESIYRSFESLSREIMEDIDATSFEAEDPESFSEEPMTPGEARRKRMQKSLEDAQRVRGNSLWY